MLPAADRSSNSRSSSTSCRSSGSISSRIASDCSSDSSASRSAAAPGSISSTMSAIFSSSSFSSSENCSLGSTSSSVSAATSSSSDWKTASRSAGDRSSRISARSDGCMSARRSYSMRSFTRLAGSTSITSTNCQGMTFGVKRPAIFSIWVRGSTPLKIRRKRAAHAHFHFGNAQQVHRAVPHPLQLDIVHADHFPPVNVDDLAVDQVLLQVDVAAVLLHRNQRAGIAQLQRSGRRLHHLVRRDNAQSGARFEHQAGDFARVRPGGDRDVLQLAAQMPLGVGHRRAEQSRKTDAGGDARRHGMSLDALSRFADDAESVSATRIFNECGTRCAASPASPWG